MDLQDDRPLYHKGRRYGYVYHTIFDHPKRGLLHYVGQHVGNSVSINYVGSGTVIKNMLKKYGWEGRVYRRIVCFRSNQNTLNRAEIRFIREAKELYGPNCLNLSYSEARGKHSDETRNKMSKSRLEFFKTEEGGRSLERLKETRTGDKRSEETKAKQSKVRKEFMRSKAGELHRKQLSERVRSPETRLKMSIAKKKHYQLLRGRSV